MLKIEKILDLFDVEEYNKKAKFLVDKIQNNTHIKKVNFYNERCLAHEMDVQMILKLKNMYEKVHIFSETILTLDKKSKRKVKINDNFSNENDATEERDQLIENDEKDKTMQPDTILYIESQQQKNLYFIEYKVSRQKKVWL